MKLVAFSDRKAAKDLASVLHCLANYLEDDERRYGIEHDGAGIPFEYTCAYLLGLDARPFRTARQLEVAREHIARIEPFAFARIGQPTTAALAELAATVIAVARLINRPRIEVQTHLRLEKLV